MAGVVLLLAVEVEVSVADLVGEIG
eukprot:COSAG05_NODE_24244_length_253_cov_0.233766_1_plen_24_part_01